MAARSVDETAADDGADRPLSRSGSRLRPAAPVVAALIAAAVMLAMGLWGLGRGSAMGNDETATRWAAGLPLDRLRHLLGHLDAVHGFYYLLMHAWFRAVGDTPTIMRVPSVLSMAAAAGVVVLIGYRLTGTLTAALTAGLVVAFTPSTSFYGQTARSYAMVFLLAGVLTLLLLAALDAETAAQRDTGAIARRWVAYAVLCAALGYLNELALLLLIAHGTTLLLTRLENRIRAHWLAASALGGAAVIPLIAVSSNQVAALNGDTRPSWSTVGQTFQEFFGERPAISVPLALLAIIGLLPVRGLPAGRPQLASVALPMLALPPAILIIESSVGRPLYHDRYVLFGEIGAALLVGAGTDRLARWVGALRARSTAGPTTPAGRTQVALAALVCLAALLVDLPAQQDFRTADSRTYNLGGAAQFVHDYAAPGDAVLFLSGFYRKVRLGYPQYFHDLPDIAMAKSPEQTGDFHGTTKPFAALRPLILEHTRVWAIGSPPDVPLPPGGKQAELLLRQRFEQVRSRDFAGVTVELWQRSD